MGKECVKDTSSGWDALTDFPGMIVDAITSFLGTLIEQVMKPVREFLADTLLATPDVTKHADVKRLWAAMLKITCGIYVLFVTAGGITVMGYETVQTRYALKQILPRLLLGMVAATTSLTVMGKAISLANALGHAIMATDMADSGQGIVERVLPFALFGVAGLKLYLLLLAILMVALVLAVLIGFMVRVAVLALLAVCAPLALACHAPPLSDPVARLWWRALGGCLVIQVAQSITFVLAVKLFFAPGATTLGIPKSDQLGTMLAGLGLFWVLFKIPGWALQVVLRGAPIHQPHVPAAVRMVRHLAMYRLMDHYLPGIGLLRRRPGGGRGGGVGGGGGGGMSGLGPRRGGPGGGGGRPRGGGGSGGRSGAPGSGSGGDGRGRAPVARSRVGLHRAEGRTAEHRSVLTAAEAGPTHQAGPVGVTPQPPPGGPKRRGITSRTPGGPAPRSPGPKGALLARASKGPRVIHPAQATPRRMQPPSPPIPTELAPAQRLRSSRRLPPPQPSRPVPAPAPAPRARQMALRVPAERVRVRPPQPMQLRLPFEPPWR
ncbi:hypothetical protein SLV14_002744 [Streptomyces sp. Je 1-4]|uniref:hypothetical protein n=1 Tax=Streptomyces TaxID=1883 RepID=UPI0021D9DAC8|nr:MULTISPECIES: hypothetical protein [unclassified Streptomyces]UYB40154.1 hypothetical protein SLV14_002744 [Streptomyces sp. Je 1-4]UZQ36245.1 hypothetical protein SLV14N_002744 [Streptomyces sp. Je 1-4] [Streptomyces sp. Je 1-4 4N24]UZQ43663.1 hypothetical protein SLV14NA_002744 [Streptomyces sp. Je 1-4] [Streptomyces sp. Je 1-4 4N24_ara]